MSLEEQQQQDRIIRGPHKYVPNENGHGGRYVAVAPTPKAAAAPPRAAGPVAGQPIRQSK